MPDPRIPTNKDRARAMRAVMAMLHNDGTTLRFVIDEARTPEEIDRLFLALIDMFAAFMRRKLKDPHGYAASWIAHELMQDTDTPGKPS
ncbi:recombinase family protein [Mycolicibacterium sarraceniae]|uniref:Uncharacterized protein n=1 Tax=Mycolicibacterium sarraceniae TaxID=1534348 RepID=A0A7I7SU41_9MYCO|nr:hypothetical protein [Mycolicibacterium sarraceniae]BBY60223.1 hypothetical protein MSAR_33590 [Mycolicibacterium sarraceniae]